MIARAGTANRPAILRWFSRPQDGAREASAQGSFPILPADELLRREDRSSLWRRINHLLSVPRPHLENLFHRAIASYARFVQQLPASEAHHHAGPGGMLDHGLEVVANALVLRGGHLLPHGDEPERVARSQDLWTYAAFTAALLHDIGKSAVDQRVYLFDVRHCLLGAWDPWQGPMEGQARYYRVEFVRERIRGLHERATPLLARFIVPSAGLSWLASDPEVFAAWVATISGAWEHSGVLGEIVRKADGESVARNLGAGDNVRLPTVRTVPLHEKLLTALRHLLAENELPLNRNGAAGWLAGDDLWLVSKRTADALRAHLLHEGHGGIPSGNDRIFDVLQEHGLVVPNGERAIWRAQVAGDGWAHELTLLRIAATRVWPDPGCRPDVFNGTVTPLESAHDSQNAEQPSDGAEASESDISVPTRSSLVAVDEAKEREPHACGDTLEPVIDGADITTHMTAPVDSTDPGQVFLAWLQEGVASEHLHVNTVNARVHVVPEGVLLVSPGIFKDFAAQHPDQEWSHVQKRFQKLKLHRKTANGTNIHRYRVAGGRKSSGINGLLIPEANAIFRASPPPPVNPHLPCDH